MEDRIPKYPGRVKLTPVPGQANVYDLVRADEPVAEGTPLNAATLLSGAVARELGLEPVSATPSTAAKTLNDNNKVFSAVFRYDGWGKSGNTWTQTVSCAGMKPTFSTGGIWFNKTGDKNNDEAMQDAMNEINEGRIESLEGQVKATLNYKPTATIDVELRFQRKVK